MFFSSGIGFSLLSMQKIFISFITERNETKKGAKTSWARRPEHKFFKSLEELAPLKQLLVFRCSDCQRAIRDSISIQRICIPLKTSSCGMFSRGLSSNVFEQGNGGTPPLRTEWRTPKGQRLESHTKTLMERVFPRNQLKPLFLG